MQRKKYDVIDICKLFCALLVAVIHTNASGNSFSNFFVSVFTTQAVPFFFIASGFFFSNKILLCKTNQEIKTVTINYVKKNLALYFAWQVVWLWSTLKEYLFLYSDEGYLKIAALIFRRIFFAGNGVYWYVLVCAESAVIIAFLHAHKLEKVLPYLIVGGLVLSIAYNFTADRNIRILNLFHELFYFLFSWTNNFIMCGIPFMGIGYFFAQGRLQIPQKLSAVALLITNIANCGIYVLLSYYGFKNVQNYCLFYIATAFFLFSFASNSTISVKNSTVFREISNSTYFLHTVFIYWLMDPFMKFMPNPFLRAGLAILLSVTVYCIAKKANLKPIKYLLSVS